MSYWIFSRRRPVSSLRMSASISALETVSASNSATSNQMNRPTLAKSSSRPARKQNPPGTAGLRALPAVSRLLASRPVTRLVRELGAAFVTDLIREDLVALRARIRDDSLGGADLREATSPTAVARRVARRAASILTPRPTAVINATGIIVHTNLGRAPLSSEAAQRVARLATSYMDLEYDVARGGRGQRMTHLEPLMERLFPGAGFLVVNNNAAAILLCLHALARKKKVILSRGELVEIGGSFRVPDILAASGARLCEVGTTNRTRLADYSRAIGCDAGLILKVHTSNFRIVGFAEDTSIEKLAALARKHELPLVVDWGSGDLVDLAPLGIRDELPVADVLAAGADLVTFSGDKLLGGPQAGFIVGRPELVQRLRRDPLARVCRIDRVMVAAIHETLAAYVRGRAFEEVPALRMLAATPETIGRRARRVVRQVAERVGSRKGLSVIEGVSRTGGGSSPTGERPTRLIAVESRSGDSGGLERALREGSPPIIGRVHEGRLLLDLRTVAEPQDSLLADRLADAMLADTVRR